jgi:hypothetical protein
MFHREHGLTQTGWPLDSKCEHAKCTSQNPQVVMLLTHCLTDLQRSHVWEADLQPEQNESRDAGAE